MNKRVQKISKLFDEIARGNISNVEKLLKGSLFSKKVDLNCRFQSSTTPLMHAIENKQVE